MIAIFHSVDPLAIPAVLLILVVMLDSPPPSHTAGLIHPILDNKENLSITHLFFQSVHNAPSSYQQQVVQYLSHLTLYKRSSQQSDRNGGAIFFQSRPL